MQPRSATPFRANARRYAEDVARTARLFLPDTAERVRRACDDLFALLAAAPAGQPLALESALESALGSVSRVEAEVERAAEVLLPDTRHLLTARMRLLRRRLMAMDRAR